jgi:hypothetical protein
MIQASKKLNMMRIVDDFDDTAHWPSTLDDSNVHDGGNDLR